MQLALPLLLLVASAAHALQLGGLSVPYRSQVVLRAPGIQAGFFDNLFKESEEQKRRKEEAWQAQQEVLRRRRDPELMEEYERDVLRRRAGQMESDRELKELQLTSDGDDKLEKWQELKQEGKVKSMDTTERDASSSRLGSEGLIGQRMDEQMPYIDSGYVDESQPDFMGEIGKLFNKGSKKEG